MWVLDLSYLSLCRYRVSAFTLVTLCLNHAHMKKSTFSVAGFFAGLSLLIENKSRRREIFNWIFPRAMPCLYYYYVKVGGWRLPKHTDVVVWGFSLAVGAMICQWESSQSPSQSPDGSRTPASSKPGGSKIVGAWIRWFLTKVMFPS